MKRFLGAAVVMVLVSGPFSPARADDKDVKAVLDKAIKALGGEEKLGKIGAYTVEGKLTLTFDGNDVEMTTRATVQDLDHYRSEFEGEFDGNLRKGVRVLNGDKGWREFGDDAMELDNDALANEKRAVYLQAIPTTLLPLKGKGFRVESAGEEKVGEKPAAVLKVTGPDGKDFTLAFDAESGLPVKLVAKVVGFQGGEYTQETTFGGYKDFGGIKKATKLESTRDGQKFLVQEVARVTGFGGEEFDQETTYASYKDFGGIKKATKIEPSATASRSSRRRSPTSRCSTRPTPSCSPSPSDPTEDHVRVPGLQGVCNMPSLHVHKRWCVAHALQEAGQIGWSRYEPPNRGIW